MESMIVCVPILLFLLPSSPLPRPQAPGSQRLGPWVGRGQGEPKGCCGEDSRKIEVAAWVGPTRPAPGVYRNRNNPRCEMSPVFLCECVGLAGGPRAYKYGANLGQTHLHLFLCPFRFQDPVWGAGGCCTPCEICLCRPRLSDSLLVFVCSFPGN